MFEVVPITERPSARGTGHVDVVNKKGDGSWRWRNGEIRGRRRRKRRRGSGREEEMGRGWRLQLFSPSSLYRAGVRTDQPLCRFVPQTMSRSHARYVSARHKNVPGEQGKRGQRPSNSSASVRDSVTSLRRSVLIVRIFERALSERQIGDSSPLAGGGLFTRGLACDGATQNGRKRRICRTRKKMQVRLDRVRVVRSATHLDGHHIEGRRSLSFVRELGTSSSTCVRRRSRTPFDRFRDRLSVQKYRRKSVQNTNKILFVHSPCALRAAMS